MAETPAAAGRYTREESEFDRALAFVDATFAFAMTLLVTTLDISDPAAPTADGTAGPGGRLIDVNRLVAGIDREEGGYTFRAPLS